MTATPRSRLPSCLVVVGLAMALAATPAVAQCALQAEPGTGVPGCDGPVEAMTLWDPDGPGPATEVLVIAGYFALAGAQSCSCLATYDPATGAFAALGNGGFTNGMVRGLVAMPNGDLVAVGDFDYVGSTFTGPVARFGGTAWSAVGQPFQGGHMQCAVVLPNGDLAVGTNGAVMLFNGSTWSTLQISGVVASLVVDNNGTLVAAATDTPVLGPQLSTVSAWTGSGSTWQPLGGAGLGVIRSLAVTPNGDLFAAGDCTNVGGSTANYIARWNGAWSALGAGIGSSPQTMLVLANGDLLVAGSFATAGGVAAAGLARWNGTTWSSIPGFALRRLAAAVQELPNGDLVVADVHTRADGALVTSLTRSSGAAWTELATGTGAPVDVLLELPGGDIVAGGTFDSIEGAPLQRIARWDGVAWSGFGVVSPSTSGIAALALLPGGDLVAGGRFSAIGGVAASNVARWDGVAWHALGGGVSGNVTALCVLPSGDLVASSILPNGTSPALLLWNGAAWSQLAGANGVASALTVMPNGDLIAAGDFTTINGVAANRIARWDGTVWSPLGGGLDRQVFALCVHSDGSLYVGGSFGRAGGLTSGLVAKWNGTGWVSTNGGISSGIVRTLRELPDGDVLAGGAFDVPDPNNIGHNIARWRSTAWFAIGVYCGVGVRASAMTGDGRLVLGGSFLQLGTGTSAYIGRIASTCPATVARHGVGCRSSGGSNVLGATLPWLAATCRATATGLPANAVVAVAVGRSVLPQGSVPLNAVLPQAGTGCDLLVTPEAVTLTLSTTGTATAAFALPNSASLVGATFAVQMAPAEATAGGALAITVTNAVQLMVGSW